MVLCCVHPTPIHVMILQGATFTFIKQVLKTVNRTKLLCGIVKWRNLWWLSWTFRFENECSREMYHLGCGVGTQNLRLRLLYKSSVCINNGKPTKMVNGIVRHLITTTWIIRLLFRPMTY
jgi:hypothetical protein